MSSADEGRSLSMAKVNIMMAMRKINNSTNERPSLIDSKDTVESSPTRRQLITLCKKRGNSRNASERQKTMEIAARRTQLLLHSPGSVREHVMYSNARRRTQNYNRPSRYGQRNKARSGTTHPILKHRPNYLGECDQEPKIMYKAAGGPAPASPQLQARRSDEPIPPPQVRPSTFAKTSDDSKYKTRKFANITHSAMNANAQPKVRLTQSIRRTFMSKKEEEEYLQELVPTRKVRYLTETTKFSVQEVYGLQRLHAKLCPGGKAGGESFMDRITFMEVISKTFGITQEVILDQLFHYFDMDGHGSISDTEWVKNLSVMLRGTLKEQTQFCFDIYDLSREGTLDRFQVHAYLQGSLSQVPGVDEDLLDSNYVRDLSDMVFKRVGVSEERVITYKSFQRAVRNDPLLLQCLGKCLPDHDCAQAFLAIITEDYNNYSLHYSHPLYPSFSHLQEQRRGLRDEKRDSITAINTHRRRSTMDSNDY